MERPESQGRIDAESSLSPPGHLWRVSRIARLAHRAILQKIQLNIELYLCKIWFFKLRKTGIFHLIIILPLHHIRPKLLRPLDFPDKIETISSYQQKICDTSTIRMKNVKRTMKIKVLPTRATEARYIAVQMFDMKTTAQLQESNDKSRAPATSAPSIIIATLMKPLEVSTRKMLETGNFKGKKLSYAKPNAV